MSQNDLTIANQGFASFRSDLNSALQALGSTNSGTSAPSTTFANQLFYDTTNNILKIRNEDNDAFISLFTLDQTNDNIESLTVNGVITADSLDISGDIDVDGTTNLDVVDIDGAVDMASTLTVNGVTTLNEKFVIDGSANDLMKFRTTGDTASQVLGLQFQNNSEAVTAQIFGTGDNSSSGVFRIKGIGNVDIITADVGVNGNPGTLSVKHGGDVHVGSGNLVIGTSGKGIDFSATGNISGTTSELLSDYEEGTWTPNVGGNTSYYSQVASYVRVGDLVFVQCNMHVNLIGTGSHNQLYGLPFTSFNNSAPQGGVNVMYYAGIATSMIWLTGYVVNHSSTVYFSGNTVASTTIQHNTQNMFVDGARVDFSACYRVA